VKGTAWGDGVLIGVLSIVGVSNGAMVIGLDCEIKVVDGETGFGTWSSSIAVGIHPDTKRVRIKIM
jgi:hypothetical protein